MSYSVRYRLEAFSKEVGGRPTASKVMVVVTDGESHDGSKMQEVIADCNKDNITRFGIAVSNVTTPAVLVYFAYSFLWVPQSGHHASCCFAWQRR